MRSAVSRAGSSPALRGRIRERGRCFGCLASIAALFATACDLGGAGDPPPRGGLYFPTALEISEDGADDDSAPDYLFVANSNFDLRYSSGSVQAIDLAAVDRVIDRCQRLFAERVQEHSACREHCRISDAAVPSDDAGPDGSLDACQRCVDRDGCEEPPDAGEAHDRVCDDCLEACDDALDARLAAIPYDDGKCFVDPASSDVFAGDVAVGSFATALNLSPDARTLIVATRTDDHLTVIPVRTGAPDGDVLECDSGSRACAMESTRPDEASDARPAWPGDPTDVLVGPMSDWAGASADASRHYALVAHRRGAVSLFVEAPGGGDPEFVLAHTLKDFPNSLRLGAVQLTGMARDPGTGLVHTSLTYSVAGTVGSGLALGRVGVEVPAGDPEQARLYDAGLLRLDGLAGQTATRALTFVDAIADASPAVSGPRALVVAEAPTSLLFANVDPTDNQPGVARVSRITEVGQGATRVVAGTVGTPGAPDAVRVAVVSCFDSREVYVVDLATGLARSVVRNLSGPFELALDGLRARLYVADFRSSIVRVLDLAPVMRAGAGGETTARLIATIGAPRIVQELQ